MTMTSSTNIRVTAAVVASALFMQNIDSTAVASALPAMARSLHVPAVHLSITITSYLVALTVFIPISGWVADRFGAKRVFMAAIATFTLASMLCALSTGLGELIAARILQGVGGAMMVPVGRLLLFRRAERHELLSATTWLTTPALIGPVLGPPLGGFLTDAFNWQSVFWINVPMGVLGLVLTWRLIPSPEPEEPKSPDLFGMVAIGASLTALMVGMETLGRGGLAPVWSAAALAIGLALFVLTVRHCARVPHPAVDFSLLGIPTFHVAAVAGSLFRIGAGALPFLVPLTLQVGFGLSASLSGLISLASALGSMCMRPMTHWALQQVSVRTLLVACGVLFAAMLATCAALTPAWSNAAIFGLLLFGGLSRSLVFATLGALAFADVPPARMSAATSLQGTAQQFNRAMGVAVAAASMQATMALGQREHALHADFAIAFLVLAAMVLTSVPLFARLDRRAGEGIASKKDGPALPAAKRAGES
jgi:EmrB/QacA subfamily drug resistance transporter